MAELGPDPLRPDADVDRVRTQLRGRRQSVGAALLDQRLVAGISNVSAPRRCMPRDCIRGVPPTP